MYNIIGVILTETYYFMYKLYEDNVIHQKVFLFLRISFNSRLLLQGTPKKEKSSLGRVRNHSTLKPHLYKKVGRWWDCFSISFFSINVAVFMKITGQVDEICPLFHITKLTLIKSSFWMQLNGYFLVDTCQFKTEHTERHT